jgi:peptide deformylase
MSTTIEQDFIYNITKEKIDNLSIIHYPNPILQNKTIDIDFNKISINTLLLIKEKMISEMISLKGIGLAANQLGLNYNMFVIYLPLSSNNQESILLINPKVIRKGKELLPTSEGCLSFPNIQVDTQRSKISTVEYYDEHGNKKERVFKGIESICAQHEIDHLNGITFIDNLEETKIAEIHQQLLTQKTKSKSTP